MIRALEWDSQFFRRRIGVLDGELTAATIASEVASAGAAGFEYLQCRLPTSDLPSVQMLERAGFYLTDIGAIWTTSPASHLERAGPMPATTGRLATMADAPLLVRHAATMFRDSRFYHDPFFSTDDADRLHAAWVTNSVSGQAADAVWIIPETGFVTCKIGREGCGEIGLIGVWDGRRRRGGGRSLVTAAMQWFTSRDVGSVTVKTQVKNTAAMNFYRQLGFDLQVCDVTLACALTASGRQTAAS